MTVNLLVLNTDNKLLISAIDQEGRLHIINLDVQVCYLLLLCGWMIIVIVEYAARFIGCCSSGGDSGVRCVHPWTDCSPSPFAADQKTVSLDNLVTPATTKRIVPLQHYFLSNASMAGPTPLAVVGETPHRGTDTTCNENTVHVFRNGSWSSLPQSPPESLMHLQSIDDQVSVWRYRFRSSLSIRIYLLAYQSKESPCFIQRQEVVPLAWWICPTTLLRLWHCCRIPRPAARISPAQTVNLPTLSARPMPSIRYLTTSLCAEHGWWQCVCRWPPLPWFRVSQHFSLALLSQIASFRCIDCILNVEKPRKEHTSFTEHVISSVVWNIRMRPQDRNRSETMWNDNTTRWFRGWSFFLANNFCFGLLPTSATWACSMSRDSSPTIVRSSHPWSACLSKRTGRRWKNRWCACVTAVYLVCSCVVT